MNPCQKPGREGGLLRQSALLKSRHTSVALPHGRASDTVITQAWRTVVLNLESLRPARTMRTNRNQEKRLLRAN